MYRRKQEKGEEEKRNYRRGEESRRSEKIDGEDEISNRILNPATRNCVGGDGASFSRPSVACAWGQFPVRQF